MLAVRGVSVEMRGTGRCACMADNTGAATIEGTEAAADRDPGTLAGKEKPDRAEEGSACVAADTNTVKASSVLEPAKGDTSGLMGPERGEASSSLALGMSVSACAALRPTAFLHLSANAVARLASTNCNMSRIIDRNSSNCARAPCECNQLFTLCTHTSGRDISFCASNGHKAGRREVATTSAPTLRLTEASTRATQAYTHQGNNVKGRCV